MKVLIFITICLQVLQHSESKTVAKSLGNLGNKYGRGSSSSGSQSTFYGSRHDRDGLTSTDKNGATTQRIPCIGLCYTLKLRRLKQMKQNKVMLKKFLSKPTSDLQQIPTPQVFQARPVRVEPVKRRKPCIGICYSLKLRRLERERKQREREQQQKQNQPQDGS